MAALGSYILFYIIYSLIRVMFPDKSVFCDISHFIFCFVVAANYMEGVGWMGSLSAIDLHSGYWIMVSEDDVLLLMGEPTSRELPHYMRVRI